MSTSTLQKKYFLFPTFYEIPFQSIKVMSLLKHGHKHGRSHKAVILVFNLKGDP